MSGEEATKVLGVSQQGVQEAPGHPQEVVHGAWSDTCTAHGAECQGTPGKAPNETVVAVSESGPRTPFPACSIPIFRLMRTYFYLPSKVSWFSRHCAVSIRSSSRFSREASASRRKLAHRWKSSSLTTYRAGTGSFTAPGESLSLPARWASYGLSGLHYTVKCGFLLNDDFF